MSEIVDFSNLYERLLKATGLSQNKDLAAEIGVNPSVLSALKAVSKGKKRPKGVVNPPWKQIIEWALRKSVSIDWLLTGKESQDSVPPDISFVYHRQEDQYKPAVSQDGNYIAVPLLKDAAAAGPPAYINERDVDSWAIIFKDRSWMPGKIADYICVRVRGKSMFPILDNGDIVAIDHGQVNTSDLEALKHLDGKICAFRIDGGVTIKWLKYSEKKGTVIGVPENKEELDTMVILSGAEINNSIIGPVRWWWSKR